MGLGFSYGPAIDKEAAFGLLRSAMDLGVALFDTAEAYGPFANEQLVDEALGPVRGKVVNLASPEAERLTVSMGRRKYSCRRGASLKRLNTDRIDYDDDRRPPATGIGARSEYMRRILPKVLPRLRQMVEQGAF